MDGRTLPKSQKWFKAMSARSKRFCLRGHDTQIVGRVNGNCRECAKENQRRYYDNNPSKYQIKARRYEALNPDKKRKWGAKRNWKSYGIKNESNEFFNREDYEKLYNSQGGNCAICKRPSTLFKRKLAVDHDHKTSEVRGLLCHPCNVVLGFIEKHGIPLEGIQIYTDFHSQKQSFTIISTAVVLESR